MDSTSNSSMCRLCLRKGLSLIDILEENVEQRYIMKEAIEDLLHFKVHKRLDLPWVVCPICCAKLDDFRNFKIHCLNSNKAFERKMSLHEVPTSPDMVDIDDVGTESSDVGEEFIPQIVYLSSMQSEQEDAVMADDRLSMEMDSVACSSETEVADSQSHTQGSATDFWRGTETALKIKIPKYLKNILKISGCDNELSMADFDASNQVPVLERFVREDMSHVIPIDCFKEDYYGIFERCPEQFRIVSGHMNILIKIAEYWKETRKPSPEMHQQKSECSFSDDVRFNILSMETGEELSS